MASVALTRSGACSTTWYLVLKFLYDHEPDHRQGSEILKGLLGVTGQSYDGILTEVREWQSDIACRKVTRPSSYPSCEPPAKSERPPEGRIPGAAQVALFDKRALISDERAFYPGQLSSYALFNSDFGGPRKFGGDLLG